MNYYLHTNLRLLALQQVIFIAVAQAAVLLCFSFNLRSEFRLDRQCAFAM